MLIGRRRTWIVNRELQVGMLLTSLGYVVFLVFVVAFALFAPLIHQLRQPGRDATEMSNAAFQILYLHETYWLPAMLGVLAIALHSIGTSHRIAGPLYRFRRVCEAMAGGVVPGRVTLRKNDQLQAELDAVNAMLHTWRALAADIRRDADRLQECMSRYAGPSAPGASDAASSALHADILRAGQQLQETVGRIRCEGQPGRGSSGASDDHAGA